MSAESLPEMKGLRSHECSPHSSESGSGTETQLSRQASDPGLRSSVTEVSSHFISSGYSSGDNGGNGLVTLHKRSDSPGSADIIVTENPQHSAILMSHVQPESLPVTTVPHHSFSELPELVHTKPLILQHPGDTGDESSMSWLYDFYPGILNTPKEKLDPFPEQHQAHHSQTPDHLLTSTHSLSPTIRSPDATTSRLDEFECEVRLKPAIEQQLDFVGESSPTVFKSQEKYEVTLAAPTSIAQRTGEDTLTYLNKGQFYTLYLKGNSSLQLPSQVKTVLALTFFEEPDKRVEYGRWQYWYNLQPNPNQKAFDIDRKNCKNMEIKSGNYHNAASFTWCPELGAKIVLRVNCLSTEFSSQKGVKGFTLHFVSDTYDDVNTDNAESIHRAFCRVKIFRDKGAERKNKDETKTVERRLQKLVRKVKQQPGACLDSELGASALFHAPSRETVFTSTSTLGPSPFLFVPQQQDADLNGGMSRDKSAATDFLASIRDRETKRTFRNTLRQTKDEFGALEVDNDNDAANDGAPPKKAPRIPNRKLLTLYVRKEEEIVYNALILDSLTVYDFKLQIAKKYDVPADMIKGVFKKTKKGLVVHFDDSMVELFQNEDDFIIDLTFDNQKGCFNLYLHY